MQRLLFKQFVEFPEITHGIFLKPFDGTDPIQQEALRLELGVDTLAIDCCVHGNRVTVIEEQPQKGVLKVGDCDGLITKLDGVGLVVNHADCQVALIYDPVKGVIGAIHSGWRSSVLNIYKEAVRKMQEHFDCRPSDLIVSIGPSLCPDRAEFINFETELPESFLRYQIKPTYFDFWSISRDQLQEAGVEKIEIMGVCTYDNTKKFHSSRGENRTKKRTSTVIAKKRVIK